jgi:general secretion pathway protein D
MKAKIFFSSLIVFSFLVPGFSQTIAEKKASSKGKEMSESGDFDVFLSKVNQDLASLKSDLVREYAKVKDLEQGNASSEQYELLLQNVNVIKKNIADLENRFHDACVNESKKEEEGYALWDQEETTLAQLVMEYGALDHLYVIPPEMINIKLNMHSSIPIPRESWGDMLEIVLAHNGVGVKKVNPYARQLYQLKQDPSVIHTFASKPQDLLWLPNHARLFYVFSPPIEQVKSTFLFFERFADAKQTFVYQIGTKIALVTSKEEIEKLLTLHQTVWEEAKGKVSKVVPVSKMPVREMEKILVSFFGEALEKSRPPFGKVDQEGLIAFSLGQGNALILIGQQEVVDRAEKVVKDTEDQLENPAEMTVHVYSCRHSDPNDLAKVLEKVYNALLVSSTENRESYDLSYSSFGNQFKTPDGYSPSQPLPVTPQPLHPGSTAKVEFDGGSDHFIPDPKTGNLLMVVRRDVLQKVKSLLKKLDVPKKMVQIEVLLFERTLNNQDNFGLNFLKIGSGNSNISYNSLYAPKGPGVLEYLFHAGHHGKIPAIDFAYNFLMTQENIQFHAAPSVITVNQTPATINIVQEISINNGAAPVDTNKGIAFEKSYTRAQYGINIVMTPTVHTAEEDPQVKEDKGSVTMQTNITFDTPRSVDNDRPLVDRRHIENEVRVVDGQTVIIGGLRRKAINDREDRIPFLGEIPGFGKLFGSSQLSDTNTEMFFFITPHIIPDPQDELEKIRAEELKKRPGDIPEFLEKVIEAQDKEKQKIFERSFKLLFSSEMS